MKMSLILVCIVFLACSLSEVNQRGTLKSKIVDMDNLMRHDTLNYTAMRSMVETIDSSLHRSDVKTFDNGLWSSVIRFKWNYDSSVVMIYAKKNYAKGFKREVLIHIGDSVLFLHRFDASAETPSSDYSFLESIDYLTAERTIKTLTRIEFSKSNIADTIRFIRKPFRDFSATVQEHYHFELDYARNILNMN